MLPWKTFQEKYATNGVTIIHKQHLKLSSYSGTYICKDKISPVLHSHQVLQVNYLQTTTTITKTLFFYQSYSNLQGQQKLYSSLFNPPPEHNPAPLITVIYLLNSPPFISHLRHLCQKITFTPLSKKCLLYMKRDLRNMMQDVRNNKNN